MKTEIKASCIQFCPVFGDTVGNLNAIIELTEKSDSDLAVFPELITSGYEFRDRSECMALGLNISSGREITELTELASDTNTHLVIGFPERDKDQVFNSSIVIVPGGEAYIYRKVHLFDREKNLFVPGDKPVVVVETEFGRIGMMICFDWIFPEICRSLALDGAQIICHPSNLILTYCQRAMFARSVENGVFTMTCNRIGAENRTDRILRFTGQSQILSPRGEILAQSEADEEAIISSIIIPAFADDKKLTPLNHLIEDRRPEFYARLQAI